MKITKMSLVAALLIGSSAFAIENTKVSGDVKVYYNTNDADVGAGTIGSTTDNLRANESGSLFDAKSSAADIAVNLNLTTDLYKNDMVSISAGAGATVLATLGLENNLVNNVWGSAHTATIGTGSSFLSSVGGAKVENASWMNELWVAATAGKTTLKLGRMELDTPIAYTEKWSIEENTFEGVVVINQDVPDTTLVGAYIGNGNGTEDQAHQVNGQTLRAPLAVGGVVNTNGEFTTYGTTLGTDQGDGAYAVGAINNSWKPLTVQAWYYDITRIVDSYWLQADLNIEGIMAGVQYNSMDLDGANTNADDVYAFMLGYKMKDTFTAKIAYSQVNDDGSIGKAGFNTATASGDSKLYTQPWWSRGYVVQTDAESYKVCVTSPVNGIVDLGVHYSNVDQGSNTAYANGGDNDLQEVTVTAGKTFGPLDATLVYSNIDAKQENNGSAYNQIQAYLTLNF